MNQRPLRFTPAFDKGVHSPLPSSVTLSTGFKARFQVNHHAAVADVHNNVSKIDVTSALIPSEQYQVVLLEGESAFSRLKSCIRGVNIRYVH